MLNSLPVAATFSKDKSFWSKKMPFDYIVNSKGAMVKGNNGTWYLDWVSGLGANLLGYEDRHDGGFYHYVAEKIRHGISYSLPHELEYIAASKLVKMLQEYVPNWHNEELQVRWILSGSDACSSAIRLAKANKQGLIFSSGYHGFGSEFIAATPPAHGLYDINPVQVFEYGSFPKPNQPVSAVIIEIPPIVGKLEYFDNLRQWCNDHKALLIIDEIVTGLRYGRGGACEKFGIEPDIICIGKALANGMPIGAVVAKKELMNWFNPSARPNNDPVFISSTNVGNVGSLAGANFILDYIQDGKYLNHIELIGNQLKNELVKLGYNVIGNAARNLIIWENDAHKGFTIDYFVNNGILLNRPNFSNMAHTLQNVDDTIEIATEAMNHWREMTPDEKEYWYDNAPLTMFRNR